MGFTKNGEEGGPPACITVATQDLTDEQEKCKNLPYGSPEIVSSCMGPLKMLIGTWKGDAGKVYTPLPFYSPTHVGAAGLDAAARFAENAGLVPGQPTSTMVAIKNQTYQEVITFKPIFEAVRNRGYANADPINAECQMDEFFIGLKYSLKVFQTNPTDADGATGNLLHEEVGKWLYVPIPASGAGDQPYDVVRQSSVPHGISFTAVGSVEEVSLGEATQEELIKRQAALPGTIFNEQGPAPLGCTPEDGYDTEGTPWGTTVNGTSQGGSPPYLIINDFLTNETRKQRVKSFVELKVSQTSFSETPFLQRQAAGTNFTNMMYIETLEDGSMQLQYFQRFIYIFMQRFDCMNCQGVTKRDPDRGCMIGCAGLDREVPFPNGTSMGMTLNDYLPLQAGKCYSCEPTDYMEGSEGGTADGNPSCAEQQLIDWPHIQLNTLRKVSDSWECVSSVAEGDAMDCGW